MSIAPDGHPEISGRRVTKELPASENQAEAARWPRGVTLPAFTIGTGRIRRFTTHHPEQADQQLVANLRRATAFAAGDERNDRDRSIIRPLVRRRRGARAYNRKGAARELVM